MLFHVVFRGFQRNKNIKGKKIPRISRWKFLELSWNFLDSELRQLFVGSCFSGRFIYWPTVFSFIFFVTIIDKHI